MSIEDVFKRVCEELNAAGFHVLYYKSVGTNSIYVKIDYGVCHTITIRDHKGKKQYKYKHNVFIDRDSYNFNQGRFYYGVGHIDQLVDNIIEYRAHLMKVYNPVKYKKWMDEGKAKIGVQKGFWQFCKEW